MDAVGYVLLVVGAIGIVIRSVEFVSVTIPGNYGTNPGFGAYESRVLPWYAMLFIGLGLLLGSWKWALVPIMLGPFALAFVATLLGRLFGR